MSIHGLKQIMIALPSRWTIGLIFLAVVPLTTLLQCGRSSSNDHSSTSGPSSPPTADRTDPAYNRPEGYEHGPREIKKKRTFTLTDTYTIGPIEEDANKLRAWLPIPLENGRQTVHEILIDANHLGYRITEDPRLGNRFVYCNIENPSGTYTVVVTSRITRHSIRAPYNSERSENANILLRETPGVPVNKKMKTLAAEQGATGNSRESMRQIYDYIVKRATYDPADPTMDTSSETDDRDPAYGLVQKRRGSTDVCALFMSLSRSVQLPTRFVAGSFLPSKLDGQDRGVSVHCWVEGYLEGAGWLPVDATFGDLWSDRHDFYFGQLDARRVAFARGVDIDLVPPASNGVRFFKEGHVELDGDVYQNWNRKRTYEELK